jgi:hypothetical protein
VALVSTIEFFLWVRDFGGYKVPIRPGAVLMAYDAHQLCFEIDAAAIIDLLAVQVRIARIVATINAAEHPFISEQLELGVIPATPPPMLAEPERKPLAHAPKTHQAERREQRKSRKPVRRGSSGAS